MMHGLSRRGAIGLGSALLATFGRAEAAEESAVIVAGEQAVLFKIKDVTLDGVDQAGRMISASFGDRETPVKMSNLPLGENFSIRVSFVRPGSVNNVPFDWDRLKGLVGHRVSLMLRSESSRLWVHSIATAND